MTLSELIAALEAADGPSRELDAEIFHAVNPESANFVDCVWIDHDGSEHPFTNVPHYTSSLDAALTLVPEGCVWDAGNDTTGPGFARIHRGKETSRETWFAATPALALCIAALKAREAGG